ncbi:hypothetical protein [Sporolactobacillus laevolacticus]|uniref:hypothetical protein n=1 Tax=Sporolactobacillus laevolacticus TaxID=33018 RepID=UPI0025B49AC4|nr:hypothetical protein [Sporolactobacillus laevolacticus]MDN3956186.1 hypothetical protein [Sporolactobacillus laevolacticus]
MSGTKVLISYLKNDAELMSMLYEQPYIFQLEKPNQPEYTDLDPFIVILEKIVNSNNGVHDVQFEFRIVSANSTATLNIQQRLIELLDKVRQEYLTDGETVIRRISLLNGGGTVKSPDYDKWETIVFFLAKI